METTYGARTVAIVALASLVAGFVVVFGGGMLALRPRAREHAAVAIDRSAPLPPLPPLPPAGGGFVDAPSASAPAASEADAEVVAEASDAGAGEGMPDASVAVEAPAAPPTSAAGITIAPASTSRCFERASETAVLGSHCDRLRAFDQHVASKAAQIAACAHAGAHGHLALVLDFRFSTSFMRGWGSPTSNIPNPGGVSACVKRVITPIPFANIPHQHDRYLVVVGVDW